MTYRRVTPLKTFQVVRKSWRILNTPQIWSDTTIYRSGCNRGINAPVWWLICTASLLPWACAQRMEEEKNKIHVARHIDLLQESENIVPNRGRLDNKCPVSLLWGRGACCFVRSRWGSTDVCVQLRYCFQFRFWSVKASLFSGFSHKENQSNSVCLSFTDP